MESVTKNKQGYDVIAQIVSNVFKSSQLIGIEELKEGYFNVAYLIKISDGREVILKIAPPQNMTVLTYEKNIMYTEVETMRLVKEHTNIPVAEVLYYDRSHTLCEADYFFMSKLEGESYKTLEKNLTDEQKRKIDYQLGKLNAELNSIQGIHFGYYGQPQKQGSNWYQTFLSMLNDALSDGESMNSDIGVEYNTVRALIIKHKKAFDEVTVPCLVHWDLWPGNVFIKDAEISGVIDFERCLWADQFMEYAFRSHCYNENFYKGYMLGDLTEMEKIRIHCYDVYLYLVMTVECDYRHYQNDKQYIWAKQKLENALKKL